MFAASGESSVVTSIDTEGMVRKSVSLPSKPGTISGGWPDVVFVTVASGGDAFDTIIKLDSELTLQWSERLLRNGKTLHVSSIEGLRDGGAVAIASSVLVRLDALGRPKWTFSIEGPEITIEDVKQLRNETYVCAGSSDGRPWLAKISTDGKLDWQHTYGNTKGVFRAVDELQSGELVTVGVSDRQALIVRTSSGGTVETAFMTTLNVPGWTVAVTGEGFVAGLFDSGLANLTAFQSDGRLRWQRLVTPRRGNLNTYSSLRHGMVGTSDGVVLGFSVSPGPDEKGVVQLAKVDDVGGTDCNLESARTILLAVPLSTESAGGQTASFALNARALPIGVASLRLNGFDDPCVPKPEPEMASSFDTRTWGRMKVEGNRYRNLLMKKDYDALEKLANELRTRPLEDPIRPHDDLYRFYRAFVPIDFTEDEIHGSLEAWRSSRPRSVPASLALAQAYYHAAWTRRGGSTWNAVTDLGRREYENFLTKCESLLDQVDAAADPFYWHLLISVKQERGHPDVRTIARKALSLHPSISLARSSTFHMTSKWGGSPQEVESFASEAAELTRQTLGDGAYMAIADQAAYEALNGKLDDEARSEFKSYSFDWKRVLRGGMELIAQAPEWIPTYHRLAVLAFLLEDRATARALFSQKELDWHRDVLSMWRSQTRYEKARQWALEKEHTRQPNALQQPVLAEPRHTELGRREAPAVKSQPTEMFVHQNPPLWPLFILQSKLQTGTNTLNLAAFLVETRDGIAAISAFPREPHQFDVNGVIRGTQQGNGRWLFVAPSGKKTFGLRSYMTTNASKHQRGVAMDLGIPRRRPPVQPLKARQFRDTSELDGRVAFIVACKWFGERCEQIVLQGQIVSLQTGTHSRLRTLQIGFKEVFDADTLAGGAVLDANGHVLAVVTGSASMIAADYKTIVDSDVLDSVLP